MTGPGTPFPTSLPGTGAPLFMPPPRPKPPEDKQRGHHPPSCLPCQPAPQPCPPAQTRPWGTLGKWPLLCAQATPGSEALGSVSPVAGAGQPSPLPAFPQPAPRPRGLPESTPGPPAPGPPCAPPEPRVPPRRRAGPALSLTRSTPGPSHHPLLQHSSPGLPPTLALPGPAPGLQTLPRPRETARVSPSWGPDPQPGRCVGSLTSPLPLEL